MERKCKYGIVSAVEIKNLCVRLHMYRFSPLGTPKWLTERDSITSDTLPYLCMPSALSRDIGP